VNRLRKLAHQNALNGSLFAKYSPSKKRARNKNSRLVGLFYRGSWRYLGRTFISDDAAVDGFSSLLTIGAFCKELIDGKKLAEICHPVFCSEFPSPTLASNLSLRLNFSPAKPMGNRGPDIISTVAARHL
jgi:hypothetical protein